MIIQYFNKLPVKDCRSESLKYPTQTEASH